MNNFFVDNLYTIILMPLWVFLLVVVGRFLNVVQSKRIISFLTLASTLYGLVFSIATFLVVAKTPNFVCENSFQFLKIEDYIFNFGVYLDNLSSLMLVVITSISLLVQLYSTKYMEKDKSFPRFFGYLNLFNFSMLGLVLSPNLFQNYVFWELVGVSSYLLIGFWYKKPSASDACRKAFLMNRIGDFALLIGTISVSYYMYQYSSVTSLATVPFANLADIGSYLYSFTNDYIFVAICILLFFGSIAKSAQFPLHTWLPDAMEGPTPVSALIHSATMVAAGVYLVARLYPIFSLNEFVMYFIASIGLFTALICAFIAITQTDFKRILAYSTSSQLGLMFLALGMGAYSGGIFHLVTHAYFKSMLFLCSGVVIHSLVNQQDVRYMGGLRKQLPFVAFSYLIGCFSASGLIFSGYYSKEMIVNSLLSNNHYGFAIGFFIVSLMTAFYMFRSYFLVFEGNYKGSESLHKPEVVLNFSVGALAFITVIMGSLTHSNFEKFISFGNLLAQSSKFIDPKFISLSIAILGLLLAFLLYNTKLKAPKIPILYKISNNKLYFDNLYDFISKRIYYLFSRFLALFDKYVVDGLVVLTGLGARAASWIFAKLQTGNFQSYVTYSIIFIAFIFAALMFAYTIIISYSLVGGV